jgi:hypothetical protein
VCSRRTKTFKARVARILVAVYALCVLAPAGALALGDAAHAAHCLTHDHHAVGQAHDRADTARAHTHADGMSHAHGTSREQTADHSHGKPTNECCGLFCLTALPAPIADLASGPAFGSVPVSTAPDDRAGRGPDLLYRPPISLLRS